MRHEHAVSEVIGAVLLIGVVMISMVVIGVIMLSTPPPEKTPKSSLTSYCIQCDESNNYEILIYHGGGESLDLKSVKFNLYLSDGTKRENIIPWRVSDGCTPEDCDVLNMETPPSLICPLDFYNPEGIWKAGQTFRFREKIESPLKPFGMEILYYPFRSSMVKVNFKDQIKTSYCIDNAIHCRDPEDELHPILKDPGHPNATGICNATFQYHVNWTDETGSPVAHNQPIVPGQDSIPWNLFKGNISVPDHKDFSNSGSDKDNIYVLYNNTVQWWLGRTRSEIARCR